MGSLYCIDQLLCPFEFLVLVLGHHFKWQKRNATHAHVKYQWLTSKWLCDLELDPKKDRKDKCYMLICFTGLVFVFKALKFSWPKALSELLKLNKDLFIFYGAGSDTIWDLRNSSCIIWRASLHQNFFGIPPPPLPSLYQITRFQVNFSLQKCYDFFRLNR